MTKTNPAAPPAPMPPKLQSIPAELKAIHRWLVWSWRWNGKKWDKPPLGIDGFEGSSTQPNRWSTHADAVDVLPKYDGLGIAMGCDGIGYVGIDLDDCVVDGVIAPEAQEIIDDLGTYTELSPSGTGVKMWLKGDFDKKGWKSRTKGMEVYRDGRYFTITGWTVNDLPIAEIGPSFLDFLEKYMAREEKSAGGALSLDEIDQDDAKETAIEKCEQIEPEINNDGSGYLMKVLKLCVLCGCDFGSAEAVVEHLIESQELPIAPESEWLEKRYMDALERNEGEFGSLLGQESDDFTDIDFTERVIRRSANRVLYVREWKAFYSWDGKRFVNLDDSKLVDMIVEVSRDMVASVDGDDDNAKAQRTFYRKYQSRKGIDAVIRLCKSKLSITNKEMDGNRSLFHCDNVVLEMGQSVRVLAHDPKNLNTQFSDVIYDKSAKCPRWEQFTREVFVDKDLRFDQALCDYVQKLFGYFMTGLTHDQSVYIFYGGGGNGKGVLVNVLEKLLGDYGSPVNQEMFVGKAPLDAIADLYGRRCVFASETSEDCALKENQVKNLTGNDSVRARRLYENLWTFKPTHKMLLSTNHKPTIIGTDRGIWRRVKMVPFHADFENREELGLQEKLYAEMPGILNWAIEGYYMMLLEGLSPPKIVVDETAKYREDMNSIQQWLNDRCRKEEGAEVVRSRLYKNYVDYCQEEGFRPRSNRKFYAELSRQGFGEKKSVDRFVTGIALVSEFE